jgi:peptide/nickel transport system substrate-binding protein
MRPVLSRRTFLARAAALTGAAIVVTACEPGSSPTGSEVAGHDGLPDIEGGTLVTDPAKMPTTFGESPEFARMVDAGILPPVGERIGQDPLVIKPLHAVGQYGGQIRRGYLGVTEFQSANRFCAGPDNLLYWDHNRENVIPNIARRYDVSNDGKELTLHLRRGMKWSDGHPFTADDIIFWREDINLNPAISPGSTSLRIRGQSIKVEKVDDLTIRFLSPLPYYLLPSLLAGSTDIGGLSVGGVAGNGGYAPKHYLEQFLPKSIGEAKAAQLAKAAGYPTWQAHLFNLSDWTQNLDLPVVTPWKLSRPINDSPWEFTANPYSIWVDSEGNQLPYIPKISMAQMASAEELNIKAISGEFDFQERSLVLTSLPDLIRNQEAGSYTIHRTPVTTMDFGLRINLAYDSDATLGELIRNVHFRRALSLGIDRNEINQTFFLATSIPSSTLVDVDNPYFPGLEWRSRWATHDVAQANQLLDEIGLTAKDGDGLRMRPDGKGPIRLIAVATRATDGDAPAMCEMVRRQWQAIGIDMIVDTSTEQQALGNNVMLQGLDPGSDDPFVDNNGRLIPTAVTRQSIIGTPYAQWYASGGKQGRPIPDSLSLLKDAMELYYQGQTADEEQRIELGKQIYRMHVDQVWSIGVVGFGMNSYGFFLAKNNLGNVPKRVLSNQTQRSMSNALPMTFFYK